MNSRRSFILTLVGLLSVLFFTSCLPTVKEDSENQKQYLELQSKIKKMQDELNLLDQRIRLTGNDQGLRDQLKEERELLYSRIERLIEGAKVLKPSPNPGN